MAENRLHTFFQPSQGQSSRQIGLGIIGNVLQRCCETCNVQCAGGGSARLHQVFTSHISPPSIVRGPKYWIKSGPPATQLAEWVASPPPAARWNLFFNLHLRERARATTTTAALDFSNSVVGGSRAQEHAAALFARAWRLRDGLGRELLIGRDQGRNTKPPDDYVPARASWPESDEKHFVCLLLLGRN